MTEKASKTASVASDAKNGRLSDDIGGGSPVVDLKPKNAAQGMEAYRAMYRAVWEFHARHYPPRLDGDGGLAYWDEVAIDIKATTLRIGAHPLFVGLLGAVWDDLEREYKAMAAESSAGSDDDDFLF